MQSFIRKSVWATVWAVTMAITVWFCLELAEDYPAILALLILAAFVESISLVYARQAWRQGNVITAVAAFWITCLSLVTLIISESSYWSSAIEGIHEQVTRNHLLREGADIVREKQKERYASLASGQTPGQIQADINAAQLHELYRRTDGCTDVTQSDSRAFCEGYFKLKADLAAAKEASELEVTVWKASTAIETPMMQRNFYEAARLGADNIGGSVRGWILGIVAALVLLMESLRLLALYIGTSPDGPGKPQETPKAIPTPNDTTATKKAAPGPATRIPDVVLNAPAPRLAIDNTKQRQIPKPSKKNTMIGAVDKWKAERMQKTMLSGGGAMTSVLWDDYKDWCDQRGHRALALSPFGKRLSKLGVSKTGKFKGSFRPGWMLKQSAAKVA